MLVFARARAAGRVATAGGAGKWAGAREGDPPIAPICTHSTSCTHAMCNANCTLLPIVKLLPLCEASDAKSGGKRCQRPGDHRRVSPGNRQVCRQVHGGLPKAQDPPTPPAPSPMIGPTVRHQEVQQRITRRSRRHRSRAAAAPGSFSSSDSACDGAPTHHQLPPQLPLLLARDSRRHRIAVLAMMI